MEARTAENKAVIAEAKAKEDFYNRAVQAASNRANLLNIDMGMSKSEVKKIMGDPYKREADEQREIWFYITDYHEHITVVDEIRETEVTALVFQNNKLVQWGIAGKETNTSRFNIREL